MAANDARRTLHELAQKTRLSSPACATMAECGKYTTFGHFSIYSLYNRNLRLQSYKMYHGEGGGCTGEKGGKVPWVAPPLQPR